MQNLRAIRILDERDLINDINASGLKRKARVNKWSQIIPLKRFQHPSVIDEGECDSMAVRGETFVFPPQLEYS